MKYRQLLMYCWFGMFAVISLISAAYADAPPPSWYQVNQDGFGFGPTDTGTYLFVFDDNLYAFNEDGWFRMENPITRGWTQLSPPNPPAGPGSTSEPKSFGNYLYAWQEQSSQLWWIAKGADLSNLNWNFVSSVGLPGGASPEPMTMFNGKIYGVFNDSSSGTFEIWRTGDIGKTTANWERVVTNSFGDPINNKDVDVMIVFNNHIYAGTTTLNGTFGDPRDYGTGVEIWESPSGDLNTWNQVNVDGFGTKSVPSCFPPSELCFAIHQVIGSAAVYQAAGQSQEYLYIGTKSHDGGEVWRYDGTGLNGWKNVTPPWAGPCESCSASRMDAMVVFQGNLYLAEGYQTANLAKYDGINWAIMVNGPNPFDPEIGGLASLALLKNKLYVSTLHRPYQGPTHGDQVWGYPFTPPMASCKNVTVPADGTCKGIASINNGSSDPDGDAFTLAQSPPGPYKLGATPVTLTVTDSYGLNSSCTGTVTVIDTTPPSIGKIMASPNILWPPDHKMVPVKVAASVSDNCGLPPVCTISSVSSNEPVNGTGDGDTAPDWVITQGSLTVNLRAERAGIGSGRVYTLTAQCSDASGNSAMDTTIVNVPHDQ